MTAMIPKSFRNTTYSLYHSIPLETMRELLNLEKIVLVSQKAHHISAQCSAFLSFSFSFSFSFYSSRFPFSVLVNFRSCQTDLTQAPIVLKDSCIPGNQYGSFVKSKSHQEYIIIWAPWVRETIITSMLQLMAVTSRSYLQATKNVILYCTTVAYIDREVRTRCHRICFLTESKQCWRWMYR